ncbi:MAG: hypothetical protein K6D03_12555 [Solobacterium sp.]|nr:hypothetical protein [Solobacterium sp.]
MNYSFEYIRLIMLVYVVFTHFELFSGPGGIVSALAGGAEAVSFFYILSGWFMKKSYEKHYAGKGMTYRNYLTAVFAQKKKYFLMYWTMLTLSLVYYIYIHMREGLPAVLYYL